MTEKVLNNKKNGMAMLVLFLLLYLLAIFACIFGGVMISGGGNPALLILGIVWLTLGWIPFCGLKILKPQEALVLTLFGKYVGTLKEEGFYFVNPFCSSVNPAAKTRLKQSGDVDGGGGKIFPWLRPFCGKRPVCVHGSPCQHEDFPEGYDAEQQPAEDQ